MEDDELLNRQAFLKAFGIRLAKLRRSRGYSQDRLALECGLARGVLSRIEAGKVDPQLTTLVKLSLVMEISIKKFFEGV